MDKSYYKKITAVFFVFVIQKKERINSLNSDVFFRTKINLQKKGVFRQKKELKKNQR
jgi:hypothetical protein